MSPDHPNRRTIPSVSIATGRTGASSKADSLGMRRMQDDELLAELGVDTAPQTTGVRTPREERIVAGFEDILRFVESAGRAPRHGEDFDIFERLYAVRLDRLRALPGARPLLAALDGNNLLGDPPESEKAEAGALDDEALLDRLGIGEPAGDITVLKHVRPVEERRSAEEIASRTPCRNFERFRPLFEQAEDELREGKRQTRRFGRDAGISTGEFFILGGQMVYVAEIGDTIRTPNGGNDARMRVIYSNGTESNLLLRSLQRALYKDEAGRRLTEPDFAPLFTETWEEDTIESGVIYVLRSLSDHPYVAANRECIHKIGVTGGTVEARIANASQEPTYLLADVEVVATYRLSDIKRSRMENLFHRIFAPAQLDLTIHNPFGTAFRPREWFLVPLHVIDEAVRRILDGSIAGVVYDPGLARLVEK
jgi:hypothetical protein